MTEYDPSVRCGTCPDPDAFEIQRIEVSFYLQVVVTQDQSHRLVRLIDDITSAPWNQPVGGCHWLFGMGSKPLWREPQEPEFDSATYFIETSARAFVSDKERERKQKQRAKGPSTQEAVEATSNILTELQKRVTDEQRLEVWEKIMEGYCQNCGRALDKNEDVCHCENEE